MPSNLRMSPIPHPGAGVPSLVCLRPAVLKHHRDDHSMQLGHLASRTRSALGPAVNSRAVQMDMLLHLNVGRIRCLTGSRRTPPGGKRSGRCPRTSPTGASTAPARWWRRPRGSTPPDRREETHALEVRQGRLGDRPGPSYSVRPSRRTMRRVILLMAGCSLLLWSIGPAVAAPPTTVPAEQVTGTSPWAGDPCGLTPNGGTVFFDSEVEPWVDVSPADPTVIAGIWQQDRWSNGGRARQRGCDQHRRRCHLAGGDLPGRHRPHRRRLRPGPPTRG